MFIRCEKGMSSLWCLFKTFKNPLPLPQFPCLCLCCSQIMFPESYLTNRVELFSSLLAINTPHSPAVLKFKLKRQESSQAFLYISVWFQTEVKGRRVRYAYISRYVYLLKIYMLQVIFFLVKISVRNAKQIAFPWQCGFNGERWQCRQAFQSLLKKKPSSPFSYNLKDNKTQTQEKLNPHNQAC